ncbi:hypothetical protein [Sulfitobacter sabulilitoris]|uniref:Cation/multidrug efflux pump n=1 Tax=Sulfitobacter sabulilitoris TaxID=2562655 RepID=A0A5S3PFE1_9RHOB|nr:hypothetical protein [Sulfitobacter sabulilitoris]TMM52765.1 hypothetical protein FDT80_10925 [Sulfitobacter sabulilitoris]
MAAFVKLVIVGFAVLTVIYISLSLYSRAVRRDKLRAQWEEDIRTGDKEDFVERGLKEYDHSLRRKLILAVYIIPVILIATIIYLTNFT